MIKRLSWIKKKLYQSYKVVQIKGASYLFMKSLEYCFTYQRRTRYFPKDYLLSEEEYTRQRNMQFTYSPIISIIVPVYNTNEVYLHEMIDSVLAQTYTRFQLCIFNGGSNNSNVEKIITKYMKVDQRITYKSSEDNLGISENTNQAIKMATGEYVCLLDHDDLLAPNALFEMINELNICKADMIYTDEDKIIGDGNTHFNTHKKADWSPDTLLSYNYICHFTLFNIDLLDKIDGFRMDYDGSQDYDFFLRLCHVSKRIAHIPKVLYHWRVSNSSTADNIFAKSYAVDAGKRAVENFLVNDQGLDVTINDSPFMGAYSVKHTSYNNFSIMIIVYGKWKNEGEVRRAYDHITSNTNLINYQIAFIGEHEVHYEEGLKYYFAGKYGFSRTVNDIVKQCDVDHIVFMDYRIKILDSNWCETLMMESSPDHVAAVSCKILKSRNKVQSFGLVVTSSRIVNTHHSLHRKFMGYMGRNQISQNVTAASTHCILVKKKWIEACGYFTEGYLETNTIIDFCLKLQKYNKFVKIVPDELFISHYNPINKYNEDLNTLIMNNKGIIKDRDLFYSIEMININGRKS